jgi:uncharacterized protein
MIGAGGILPLYLVIFAVLFALAAAVPPEQIAKAKADKLQAIAALRTIPIYVSVPLAVFAGTYEELVFRGFLQGRLTLLFGAPSTETKSRAGLFACLVGAVLFGLGHGYQGALGVVQTGIAGLCFGLVRYWRGSVYAVIGTHIVVDVSSFVMLHFITGELPGA